MFKDKKFGLPDSLIKAVETIIQPIEEKLVVPNTDKVAASSVADYFSKRAKKSDGNNEYFRSVKSNVSTPSNAVKLLPKPDKTLVAAPTSPTEARNNKRREMISKFTKSKASTPATTSNEPTHSALPAIDAHHNLHAPTQQKDHSKPKIAAPPSAAAVKPNKSGTTAAAIAARQRVNSSGNARTRDGEDPMGDPKYYDNLRAGKSPASGTSMADNDPRKLKSEPKIMTGKTGEANREPTKPLPAEKTNADKVQSPAAKARQSGKLSLNIKPEGLTAETPKIAGKNSVVTSPPKHEIKITGGKKPANLTASKGKSTRTSKSGNPVAVQIPMKLNRPEGISQEAPDLKYKGKTLDRKEVFPDEKPVSRSDEIAAEKVAREINKKEKPGSQISMFGDSRRKTVEKGKFVAKLQPMPDHVVDTNRAIDGKPAIRRVKNKAVKEEISLSEKELEKIKKILGE